MQIRAANAALRKSIRPIMVDQLGTLELTLSFIMAPIGIQKSRFWLKPDEMRSLATFGL
jgi:hypothetical protein